MAMNFGGYYDTHNYTMRSFIDKFNSIDDGNTLMIENRKETYLNDGSFLISDAGIAIGFDWEFRKTGYPTHGNFQFAKWGLGQYGTKLAKPSIKISLQIAYDGTGLLVGWHDDFEKINDVELTSETKQNRKEPMSCTLKYKEYELTDEGIKQFKEMINRAAISQIYNHTVFAN